MGTFGDIQWSVQLVVLTVFTLLQTKTCTGAEWSYDDHHGQSGPSYWKNIAPACGGSSQSPIDVVLSDAQYKKDMTPIAFEGYDTIPPNVSYTLVNNGHTVQLNVLNAVLKINGGGLPGSYQLVQFHVHWGKTNDVGSEHKINGKFYPMEIHFVHFSNNFNDLTSALTNSTGLAVIGVFVEVGERNSAFDEIITQFSSVKYKGTSSSNIKPFRMSDLLPAKRCEFIRYPGSLTTPGCQESVVWTILQYPITISEAQLNAFRALSHGAANEPEDVPLVNNFRPVQKVGTRKVLRSYAVEVTSKKTSSGTVSFLRFHGDALASIGAAVLLLHLLY